MSESIKKVTKILDELVTYFLSNGNSDIHVDIERNDEFTKLSIIVKSVKITKDAMEELYDSFSIPRQDDIDQYYWQLNGGSESEMEMDLIGMMIDSFKLRKVDKDLHLELIRKRTYY